jgi:hypothetical protein
MNNYLILRTLTSPYSDVTKGSVLSQAELDDNFIFLKGNVIYTAETSGATVTLKKYNGESFSFIAGGSGIFTGGTIVGPTVFTNGATANTLTVNGVSITGDTYTIGSTLIGTTAYFDTNTALSAYTLDLSSIVSSASFSGGTVNGPTNFTAGLTANSLTVNGVEITGDTYTIGSTLIGTTAYFDTNTTLSAYTLDLSSIANSYSFTGGTVNGPTNFTSGLTANTLTVNGVAITGDSYVTSYGYDNANTFTIGRNNGLPDLTATINSVTGLTVNGDLFITGVTSGTTAYFDNLTAGTISASSLTINGVSITGNTGGGGASADTYVTAYTYNNQNVFTISRNEGLPDLTAYLDSVSGLTVNGDLFITGVTSGNTAIFNNLTATTITLNGVSLSAFTDTFVTGGTYSNGTATFRNNSGTTFSVTGFSTGYTLTSSAINTALGYTPLSAYTDTFVTGGTYSEGVYTYTNNSGGTFNVSATTTYAAGIISGSSGWSNSSGEMNLPAIKVALFNNSNNIEPILVYDIASGVTGTAGISSLTNNDTNYVMVEYNNGSPRYFVSTTDNTNDSDVVLVYIVYRLNTFVHVLEFGDYGAGLANKLNDRIIMTDRFGWESGLNLGLSGSTGVVTLTGGIAWNGSYRESLAAVNSQDDIFFKNYHSGGTWVYTTTGDTLNNSYYDDGTNIVSGTTGKYLVNYYYRGLETNDHLYEVYGNGQYDSVALAEASSSPELPELVSSHAFLVGRIVVGVGETTGITQTAFGTVFQPSGYAPSSGLHNSLSGLQGGTSGEYYHLTQNQINNLILRYTADVTFTGSVQQTITHSLNSQAIVVQLWDSSNKLVNGADIVANAVNTVQITVATSGNYKIVVIG